MRAPTPLLALLALVAPALAAMRRAPLATWRFRSLNGSVALANASTPGSAHTHLLDGGVLLADPYARFNEVDMAWIARTTWVYETDLPVLENALGDARVVFETLDGVAHVALNGHALGEPAVNAFRPHEFVLPQAMLRGDGANTLQVVFTPPLEYMEKAAAAYPYEVPATRNFNVWAEPSHRPFLRKAGSDFGWDWGPAYASSGITGDARIEWRTKEDSDGDLARLDGLNVVYAFPAADDFSRVRGNVTVNVRSVPSLANTTLRLLIGGEKHGDDVVAELEAAQDVAVTEVSLPFELMDPTLWWPAGSGEAHLYDLRVEAYGPHDQLLATLSHRVGFRSVELVQEPTDAGGVRGGTFFFRVNGVAIFMKGANWIPNNSFPTRVTPDKVEFLLQSALASNMNMLRVWGGGRYESDAFYETCDSLGLLVWHEFMFACAMYPRDRAFLVEVEKEVDFQTRRLRKHTSVAIWGGNNENENMMQSFANGDFMPSDKPAFNRDVAVTDFTALFVDTLRPIVVSLDTSRPFVDTSPSNGLLSEDPYVKRWGANTNDVAYGDVHYYNYSGDCQDPSMYPHARFVSEFGFQSMPSFHSLKEVSTDEDWSSFQAFWRLLKFRERHENGTAQMAAQIQRRFHVPFPFLDEAWLATPLEGGVAIDVEQRVAAYLYLTQIQQGLCYQTAIEAWRRGRHEALGGTMGILYWQLNDVWQGTSWSSIEFSGRWKSLHYAVRRAFAPVLLTLLEQGAELVVYGVNDATDRDLALTLVYELVATATGRVVHTVTSSDAKRLPRLSSEPLDRVSVASLLTLATGCDATSCLLRVRGDPPLAEDAFWFFAPFKQLQLRHGSVRVAGVTRVAGAASPTFDVKLRGEDAVALFVELEAVGVRGFWDRNSLHLVGNVTQTLRFSAADAAVANASADAFADALELRWLQQTYESEAVASVA